ncbi:uncharacterized protein LOC128335629 isoform X2 [Hemicordylus capensis]|uniref:uncharacterized protein LOC128335629 isoform X2 n=1 Tax=Hemicordylus capensis TaxID=884348 RepID=UPI0023020339|nr:uncharacterized protein LOC128335629 isoform X2 [Hemicordylus capensis]
MKKGTKMERSQGSPCLYPPNNQSLGLIINRMPKTSMETLYSALQDEIQSFKEHVRSCQQAFDIQTLYNVLLLLSGNGGTVDIQSFEELEGLAESQEWDGQDIVRITASHKNGDIPSYVSWFVSYVRYLGSLKEEFDTKVVFPLCKNLYVNDDPIGALPLGRRQEHSSSVTTSVAHTAKHLFSLRRKWALLLKGGTIDEQFFSPQSRLDLQGFANIHAFIKVLRLVPDLFHKSLAAALLARQWVELHASTHSPHPAHLDPAATRRCNGAGLVIGTMEQRWYNGPLSQPRLPQNKPDQRGVLSQSEPSSSSSSSNNADTCVRTTSQERNRLYEIHGELMSLLWREKRSWALEAEIKEANQRISNLQLQWEDKERELEVLGQQVEKDSWKVSDMQCWTALPELDAFKRQLRLEEYHRSILWGDWLLELELQECYQELAGLLQGTEEISCDLPQSASRTDFHSSPQTFLGV